MNFLAKWFARGALVFVLAAGVYEGLHTASAQGGGGPPAFITGTTTGWTVQSGCTTTPAENPTFTQSGRIVTVVIPGNSCTVSGAPNSACIGGSAYPPGIIGLTTTNGYMSGGPGTNPAGTASPMVWLWNGTVGFCVLPNSVAALSGTLAAGVIAWNTQTITYQNGT